MEEEEESPQQMFDDDLQYEENDEEEEKKESQVAKENLVTGSHFLYRSVPQFDYTLTLQNEIKKLSENIGISTGKSLWLLKRYQYDYKKALERHVDISDQLFDFSSKQIDPTGKLITKKKIIFLFFLAKSVDNIFKDIHYIYSDLKYFNNRILPIML